MRPSTGLDDPIAAPSQPTHQVKEIGPVDIKGSALVTGASRGIGRSIAVELANRGFDTVAAMRNPDDGADLAGMTSGRLRVARMDVTRPHSYQLPSDLRVLVNNAGVDSDYLPVEHSILDDWRKLFETNVLGLVGLTMAAIPTLRANTPAVVCNVTSSSILASVPFYSAYRATKAAVSAFGDSLRVELAPSGVRVVEILPGPINTDMFQLSTGGQAAARFERYRTMADKAAELRRQTADPLVSSPAEAAVLIADAILDEEGPMRYGCDPLSVGLLDLWRQSDDETMFELTGRSLVDHVRSTHT
jgi:NAD(P)-dependent dehydrogenase (short-subunit alcohol dehydrogenase family)